MNNEQDIFDVLLFLRTENEEKRLCFAEKLYVIAHTK